MEARSIRSVFSTVTARSLTSLILVLTLLDMVATPTHAQFILYGHFLFNAVPAILIFTAAIGISCNPGFSAVLASMTCALFYLLNGLKLYFWDEYLFPSDFFLLLSLDDALPIMAENTGFWLGLAFLVIAVSVPVALAVAWRRGVRTNLTPSARASAIFMSGALALGLYAVRGEAEPVMRQLQMTERVWKIKTQVRYGLFNHLYLTNAVSGLNMAMFEGSPDTVANYAANRPTTRAKLDEPPNIVALLAESFFDPKILQAELLADPMRDLRTGGNPNRSSGLTRVHTFGGSTWVSEYTFLTGIPAPLFGPAGRWPFAFADSDTWTIARALKEIGYKTFALYATTDDFVFMSRPVYLGLGFDHFLAIDDIRERFGEADGTVDGQILNAIDKILSEESGPVFIFASTFDLHSPYVEASGARRYLDASLESPQLNEYFRQQAVISEKVGQFLDKLDRGSGKLLFAMFGDHLPPIRGELEQIGFRESLLEPLYRTPYILHSTYGGVDAIPPYLDLSYLAGLVLDQAGLNSGEYFHVNSVMRHMCGGRFVACEAEKGLLQSYHAYLGTNITLAPNANLDSTVNQ